MGCVRVLHDSGYSKSHPANFANVCKIRKTLSGSIKILGVNVKSRLLKSEER